jgi:hypothetical protein
MTHDDVRRSLDRPVAAWLSYEPATVGDLATIEASCRPYAVGGDLSSPDGGSPAGSS